jgi:hypothetical protein
MRRFLLACFLIAGTFSRTEAVDQGGSIETWVDGYDEGDPTVVGWFRATYSPLASAKRCSSAASCA